MISVEKSLTVLCAEKCYFWRCIHVQPPVGECSPIHLSSTLVAQSDSWKLTSLQTRYLFHSYPENIFSTSPLLFLIPRWVNSFYWLIFREWWFLLVGPYCGNPTLLGEFSDLLIPIKDSTTQKNPRNLFRAYTICSITSNLDVDVIFARTGYMWMGWEVLVFYIHKEIS